MRWVLGAGLAIAAVAGHGDESAPELYQRAEAALRERRFAQAQDALERCLQVDSTFYDAHVPLARLYVASSAGDRGVQLLERAMRLSPERTEAPLAYSELLARQGRSREAYLVLRKVTQTDPDSPEAWMGIGYLRMEPTGMMNLEEAGSAFAAVLETDPDHLEAAFNLGKVQLAAGARTEAAGTFASVLIRGPDHFGARYQLGMALFLAGDYRGAQSELRRAAELAPQSLEALWALRLASQQLGGYPPDLPASYWLELPSDGEAPRPDVRFTDVAVQAGVARADLGRGSAWADYDGDGDLDLFTTGHAAGHGLYRNDGARFVERTQDAGLAGAGGFASLFADYDNDGDPDLYITRNGWYGAGANTLFRNEGGERFADVSGRAGVDDGGSSLAACWGDVDGDGHLELFVANGVAGDGSANRLFHADGRGGFDDAAQTAGVAPGRSTGCAFGDYDNDGDLDLYVANFGATNLFYRNDSDPSTAALRFADVSRQTGTQLPMGAYLTFFFDYDNDGDLDLFCSELSDYEAALFSLVEGRTRRDLNRPALYRNEGDGSFADRTYQAGLGKSYGTVGANYGDFDGDGYPDIYLANGGAEVTRLEPDALLLNQRDGTFVDIGPSIGLRELGKGHGVTFADYDGDGDQDIYVPMGGAYPGDRGHNRLYRNDSNPRNHLVLRLVGTRSNRDAVGARVRLRAGGRDLFAEVSNGGGFGVTNSLQLELGLGAAEVLEELEINWPSGQVDVYRDVAANRVLVVKEEPGKEPPK